MALRTVNELCRSVKMELYDRFRVRAMVFLP